METLTLNQKLAELKEAAQSQTQAYESSRDQLYQNIVDAYLWWKDASQDDRYLKDQYKQAGIVTRARKSNTPNFYPLVRLIWNIDITKKASTVSDWSKSLVALHQYVADDTDKPTNNLRNDLINHIHDAGGLSELRGEKRMTEEELVDEEGSLSGAPKNKAKAGSINDAQALLKLKGQRAKAVDAKAKMPSFPSAITDADDFVVMLARRNRKSNELEIVGSNYTESLVKQALLECTDIDRASVSPSLRLLAEAMQPHAVPAKLEKYRKSFFENSKTVKREQDDATKQAVKESTTLIVHGDVNKITMSKSPQAPTCVTTVTPKNLLLHTGNDLVLRGADRSWIERELINNQKLALYSTDPASTLVEDNTQTKTRYSMELSSEDHSRKLYFYDKSELPADTSNFIKQKSEIDVQPDWKITASPQWLAEFEAECFGRWIAEVKSHFTKKRNQKIALAAGSDGVELLWWWEDKKYQKSFVMPFSDNAEIEIYKDSELVEMNPRDAMLLFSAIPSLPLASQDITIQAWDGAIIVTYETDIADYRSVLPAYFMYENHAKDQEEAAKLAKKGPKK